MSWGEFTWTDLHPERRRDRRSKRTRAVMVNGDPVPWMDYKEEAWASKVYRALPSPLDRPFLTFVLPSFHARGRRALDDYLHPVLNVLKTTPVSLWGRLAEGDNTGLRIAEAPPPFPPKIERLFEIELVAGYCEPEAVAEAIGGQPLIRGSNDVAVHITLRRLTRSDCDYSGNLRVIFDGLSTLLGGDLTRPADNRIRDVRVVRDSHAEAAEIRLWEIQD